MKNNDKLKLAKCQTEKLANLNSLHFLFSPFAQQNEI